MDLIPGSGRSPRGGHGNPLQYSCLENLMERGAWQAAVHGVTQNWTRLKWLTWVWVNSGCWWWTGRPGMLWFMGSQRIRHDWVTDLNWTELRECSEQYLRDVLKDIEFDQLSLESLWIEKMSMGKKKSVLCNLWKMPVQVWCRIQDAWCWCAGMTQRDGTGREVGGKFKMGNKCTSVADSCWCMAKPIQYFKVISLQLK